MGMFPFQRWEDRCHSGMPGFSPVRKGNQQPFTSGASTGSQSQPLIPRACYNSHFLHHAPSAPFPKALLRSSKEGSLQKNTMYFPAANPDYYYFFVLRRQCMICIHTLSSRALKGEPCLCWHLTGVNAIRKNKLVSPDKTIQSGDKWSSGNIQYLHRDRNKFISHQG